MNAGVQRTSVIFIKSPAAAVVVYRLLLIGQQLSPYSRRRLAHVPSAEIGNKHLIKIGSAERDIRRAGDHRARRVVSQQLHLSVTRHLVYVVGRITSHVQIARGIESNAVGYTR